jgi:hypothetical protein
VRTVSRWQGVSFGEIPTVADFDERSRTVGASEEERGTTCAARDEDYERGYRLGSCYSMLRPEGEWRSSHVSQRIAKLSRVQFEEARAAGWNYGVLVRQDLGWPNTLLRRPWADGGTSVSL